MRDDPSTVELDADIARLTAALGDATRRRVFFALRQAGVDQTKDEVAAALSIDRRLAGFHLDKLVESGFVQAQLRRTSTSVGPRGPGRPPKRYRVAPSGVLIAQPERHYQVLATLLMRVREEPDGESQAALERVGFRYGMEVGLSEAAAGRTAPTGAALEGAVADVARLLSRMGFGAGSEPAGDGVTLRACTCPFEELAFADPARICGLDRAIWRGMIAVFAPDAQMTTSVTRAEGKSECRVMVQAAT